MRAKLNSNALAELFSKLRLSGHSISEAAEALDISARTLRSWRQGEYTIPQRSLNVLMELADHRLEPEDYELISEQVQKSRAGQLGARAQWRKHGPLGTQQSRRVGGRRSYESRKSLPSDIYSRKAIRKPRQSQRLAEFIGIMIGDGGLTKYHARITLNSNDDRAFAAYVAGLAHDLFDCQPQVYERKKRSCTVINLSSISLVDHLHQLGLPIGNKCKQGITIPKWVLKNERFVKACLRGLFDTDGCIYLEKHRRANKTYSYPRLALASASDPLLNEASKRLNLLGINAKAKSNQRLNIEAFEDIEKYFKLIGTSNPKHLRRWRAFTEESYSGLVHQS